MLSNEAYDSGSDISTEPGEASPGALCEDTMMSCPVETWICQTKLLTGRHNPCLSARIVGLDVMGNLLWTLVCLTQL